MKYLKVIVVLVLIAMFSCIFIGCDKEKEEEEKSLSSGFAYDGSDEASPELFLDYRADAREFDIENVQLDVSFGWLKNCIIREIEEDLEYSLIILNECDFSHYCILTVIERFNSTEYMCDFAWKADVNKKGIEYNHSERIIVPTELFVGETGMIMIAIIGEVYPNTHLGGGSNSFKYAKIEGNRVKLSAK